MKLRSLVINKLPGIDRRIEITNLPDGITFISGPNASGKTSLIRALAYLLSTRQKHDPPDLILEAQFEIDGVHWTVSRTGGDPIWRKMGQLAERPNLPAQDLLECHLIRIEDLIAMGHGNDEALADILQRELDGGLDLRATRQRLTKQVDFKASHQNRAVTQAREHWHQVRNEHRALAAQQQNIPKLEQEIAAAKHSLEELTAIEWAMEAVKYRQIITSLTSEKAALPQALATLSGQEIKQIETLEQQQKKSQEELNGVEKSIQTLSLELEATGMAAAIPDRVLTQTVNKHLETIRSIDQMLLAEEKQLGHDQTQLQKALERLGIDATSESNSWPILSVSDVDQAQTLARKIDRAHQMANQISSDTTSQPSQGIHWLAPGLIIFSGVALAGLVADQSVFTVLALAAVTGLSVWHIVASRRIKSHADPGANSQLITALEAEAQNLADKLGFHPALLSENASLVFADAHRQYQAAMDKLNEGEQAIAYNRSRLKETRDALHQCLADFSTDIADAVLDTKNATNLQALIEDWLHNSEIAYATSKEIRRLRQTQTTLLDELKETELHLGAIYEEASLPVGAKETLHSYLNKRSQWEEIENKIASQQALLDDRMDRLTAFPHLKRLAEANDEHALEAALKKNQSASEQLEQLQERLIRVQHDIEQASTGNRLSQASAELDQAIDELDMKRTQALEAQAGLFWLDAINEQTRKDQGDRTFDHARALFLAFTHHQWILELDETFVARRTRDQAPIPLSQLSTATRMQLLLAVRMARVLKVERNHHSLPLFIDEALTTSDPQRAAAVITNLQALAVEQDRQIIYLAASDYELQLWHHLTDKPPIHIELEQRSRSPETGTEPRLEFRPMTEPPPPKGQSANEYASMLGIEPLARFVSVDDLALFYVLADDLNLLHKLMTAWRLTMLGPFERWLQTTQGKTQFEPSMQKTLQRRCQVIRRWWSAWHEGRAKKLTEGILHRALDGGGLTDATLPGVIEATHTVGFDGEQLLSHLEEHPISMNKGIRRINRRQRKLLREFLGAEGYLPIGSPLNAEERRQRAFERLSSDISSDELQSLGALIDRLETGARLECQ